MVSHRQNNDLSPIEAGIESVAPIDLLRPHSYHKCPCTDHIQCTMQVPNDNKQQPLFHSMQWLSVDRFLHRHRNQHNEEDRCWEGKARWFPAPCFGNSCPGGTKSRFLPIKNSITLFSFRSSAAMNAHRKTSSVNPGSRFNFVHFAGLYYPFFYGYLF